MERGKDTAAEQRIEDILAFSRGIMNGENGRELIERYKTSIETLTPHDMIEMENRQLQSGASPLMIKATIGKVLNTIYKALSSYVWKKPQEGEFLFYLMAENRELEKRLGAIKEILKSGSPEKEKPELLIRFIELVDFNHHYVKKENILFPYLEKGWENYLPLQVMWSLHDDARKSLKKILNLLQDRWSSWKELNREIGNYFFLAYGMIFKEDLIVYPVAYETISRKDWEEMYIRSFEFPFVFINPPPRPEIRIIDKKTKEGDLYQSDTGNLTVDQLEMLFRYLPSDITYVDENDRVVYFSRSEERIFPRSPAVIGRKVQNCHPPESVHIVNKIIRSFREGTENKARFWININDKKLLIEYFAMRDKNGAYRGVLEVTTDITEIQTLTGEKRILDGN